MFFPTVRRPRPLLFDLGDTLINFSAVNPLPYLPEGTRLAYDFMVSQGLALPAFKKYAAACRRTVTLAFVGSILRRRELDLLRVMDWLHRRLDLRRDPDFLLLVAERFYQPMKRLGTVEEGMHAVLDRLVQDGHPLGIVSNTMVPGRLLDQHLDEEGLLQFFPVRVYSCDVGVKKPHPAIFLAALRALNVRPRDTLFIGDKIRLDIAGARRHGMITVLKVRKGAAPKSRVQPDHVIKHLTELPGLLERIGSTYEESQPLLSAEELTRHYRARAHQAMPAEDTMAVSETP